MNSRTFHRTFQVKDKEVISFYLQPKTLVFLDYRDRIIGTQSDPSDPKTQKWAGEGKDWGVFNDFAKCEIIDDEGYCYLDHSPNYPDD